MINYKVDRQTRTLTVYSIKYIFSDLKEIIKKENAEGFQIIHDLNTLGRKSNIQYKPVDLVLD